MKSFRQHPNLRKYSDKKIDNSIDKLLGLLKEEPLTTRKLKKSFPDLSHDLSPLIRLAMVSGKIIRATANHAKNKQTTYALTSKWQPNLNDNKLNEQDALIQLIEMYISTFGPVTANDISWWLSISKKLTNNILEDLTPKIEQRSYDNIKFYTFKNEALVEDISFENNILFLPYEDHFPKAFIERSWFMNEEI
ncbi:MAG: DNA glycosylase AlkZ-like family protein [Candidatus Hodarchaeales archaeon]|jgi:hypothetical protein